MIEKLSQEVKNQIVFVHGCWEWIGRRSKSNHETYRSWTAYRYVWEVLINKVPRKMHLHHICKNPALII
jgi:hypothetical protein